MVNAVEKIDKEYKTDEDLNSYPPSIRAVFMKNKNDKLEKRKIFIVPYRDGFVDNSSQETNIFTTNLILGKSIIFMLK